MAYIQLTASERKRNMMSDYEKIVNGLIDNPHRALANPANELVPPAKNNPGQKTLVRAISREVTPGILSGRRHQLSLSWRGPTATRPGCAGA